MLFLLVFIFVNASALFSDVHVDRFGNTYTYSSTIPYRYVSRVTIHENFTNIYLDNGSVWRTNGFFSKKEALLWNVNDSVVIYQNSDIFHKEKYYLYNTHTGGICYVDISCCPALNDVTYFNYKEICYSDNVVTMQNGNNEVFYFQVNYYDVPTLNKWTTTDSIVLGRDSENLTKQGTTFPYLLINTNTNEHVRAEFMIY